MKRTKIVFLILPDIHLLDLAGAQQVFLEANDYGANIVMDYCSAEPDLISSARLPLGDLKYFTELKFQAGDFLFVPGMNLGSSAVRKSLTNGSLIQWTQNLQQAGVNICSVCTGAFFLGAAGLLDGRKCTTHWKRTDELKKKYPAIHLQEDVLFTEDRGVYTSAGVTAGIDLALHILEKMTDEVSAYKVARELVVYLRRKGSESQQSIFMKYRSHIHSGVHRVQDYLQENLEQKLSLIQLADKACMSTRNLTRTFKKETGITVNEYTVLLRKELLKQLKDDPDLSRKQMAKRLGLRSERQVIRLLNTM